MAKEELTIVSDRLELASMTPEFLEACLAGDSEAASGLLGLEVHEDWLRERGLMRLRMDQMRRDPALEQWLLRAICVRRQGTTIGHMGFHDQPGNDDLRDLSPGGAEFGYSIFPPFRRRGYATEACGALMDWASREHHVPRFVVSISPENLPSLRIASRFGFRKVGSHVDEEDGPEDILVRDVAETR
ncbi:MAG: GNAT family N-acetyltransferase [Actinomycetota bacterium]|jgi:RimJ/RimL family protein N-acetyltransferase|nr:GNAT family N-acetyltransferase [Actinomycetota bacterium]